MVRAMFELSESDRTRAVMSVTPGWAAIAAAHELDDDTVAAILEEAAKLSRDVLTDVGIASDREGCRLEDGRVKVPSCYHPAFAALAEGGWQAMDLPEEFGGLGLPTTMHIAATSFFEAEAQAFMMCAPRPAAHLILSQDKEIAAQWLPKMAAGEWATTICISEPDAGSDVGRIRTKAVREGDGWRVSGTKCWISFGDHDLTERIGHCMLARTGTREEGTRGLSLFLVPDRHEDGTRNGVSVSRIEEKMGIHGSPTCVMAFENAEAVLLGQEGRGIQQMFRMIEMMRLQTACQGLAISQRATRLAAAYAAERKQGGEPAAPPVPILRHADVRRQLTVMAAATEILRAVLIEISVLLDLARMGEEDVGKLAAFLLPLAKTFGGETAFGVASGAVQVFGGAGYTQEWPVEQLMRDARIITIYEGTTGIQAQDFLHRRLVRDGGETLALFLERARRDVECCPLPDVKAGAAALLDQFQALAGHLRDGTGGYAPLDVAADGFLRAGWLAVSAMMAARLARRGGQLAQLAQFRMRELTAQWPAVEAACRIAPELLDFPGAEGA